MQIERDDDVALAYADPAAVVAAALARALKPRPRMEVWEWAEKHLVLSEQVTSEPGPYRTDIVPFSREIMDCLAPWHPASEVTFCCSAQVSKTQIGVNWVFSVQDMDPGPALIVQPTLLMAQNFRDEKIKHMLDGAPRLAEQLDKEGSKKLFYQFESSYMILTGANSAADLSGRSMRYAFNDEIDRWPLDLDQQGDPMRMVRARQKTYIRSGKAKTFNASTPTEKSVSRIWAKYKAGDQRQYHVPCPHCHELQVLRFKPDKDTGAGGLRFNKEAPFEAAYICGQCGAEIEHWQKSWMMDPANGAKWIAGNPGPGRQPSFHINALYSPFETWDAIAEEFLEVKDKPLQLKGFVNLTLGEPWEERGEVPDHKRLMLLREDYPARIVPHGGLLITVGVDVQGDGVFYEVVAWGRDGTSWSIDFGFLPGTTSDANDEVWERLEELYNRQYIDAYGNRRPASAVAIDSGYNSHRVYEFCRRRQRSFAVKGMPGWFLPPIGTPTKVDVNTQGKRITRACKLWPVGIYNLKSELYDNLRKEGIRDGAEVNPPGYCYFSQFHDENYFKQLTSEKVEVRVVRGHQSKVWEQTGPNHLHDCRIYAMAVFHFLTRGWRGEQWDEIEARLNVPPEVPQGDLFLAGTGAPKEVTATDVPAADPETTPPETPGETPPDDHPPRRPSGRSRRRVRSRGVR